MILDFKRNDNIEITPIMDECYITLSISWDYDISIILENSIYIYTTKYDSKTKSIVPYKHYLLSNLKLNTRSTNKTTFQCKNIVSNVKLLIGQDLVNVLRDITITDLLK